MPWICTDYELGIKGPEWIVSSEKYSNEKTTFLVKRIITTKKQNPSNRASMNDVVVPLNTWFWVSVDQGAASLTITAKLSFEGHQNFNDELM